MVNQIVSFGKNVRFVNEDDIQMDNEDILKKSKTINHIKNNAMFTK